EGGKAPLLHRTAYIVLLLVAVNALFAEKFVNTGYIDYGVSGKKRSNAPKYLDINRNGIDDLILSYTDLDSSSIRFYEYTGDSFVLMGELKDTGTFSHDGIGDFDTDGLYEMLIYFTSHKAIATLEQPDSFSYPTGITWMSDTIWQCSSFLGSSNKFRNDSIDIIYGNGNPLLSTPVSSKGWFYMTSTGDDQYELLNTYVPDTVGPRAMDVGDIDNDGACDVMIVMHGNLLDFEAQDALADSFVIKWRWSTQDNLSYVPLGLLIYPDIDKDLQQEIGFYSLKYLSPSHSYVFFLTEDTTGTGKIEIIWEDSILVGYDNMFVFSSNMTYGDIDGDGLEELVICGGRTVRAYDVLGNDSIVAIWEWTCPTYDLTSSHVTCHDFNLNGYDEIIFSGTGDALFEYGTYIFEDSIAVANGIQEKREQKEVTELQGIRVTGCKTIEWITQTTQGALTIYDISGREVIKEESKKQGEHKTDIRQLKNGIYFIQLEENSRTLKGKLVKIK
ncbi:MAG: T9SS type A sorting domain-containing protein, partial [bacterium]|nr:T9SS type A sorting domain-containing protein [bacterium]